MYFNKSLIHHLLFLSALLCFGSNHICPMQSSAVKTKKNFDATSFQQQLNRLPRDVQRYFIAPSFWQRSQKLLGYNNQIINTETIFIDYRLIPAIFSLDFIKEFADIIYQIKFLREGKYFVPVSEMRLYLPNSEAISVIKTNTHDFNLFAATKSIRDNPNLFLIIGSSFKTKTYIHESHLNKLENLTTKQLNFISDLFKAQFNINKATKLNVYWQRPKIILNEAQTRLFYSLPTDIQKNLKKNYRLAASTQAQFIAKTPRVSAGLARFSRLCTKYNKKPLVRLAKIAIKTGLVYYGLKWAASSKVLQNRNGVLLRLLNHKKKFILGTAALIGTTETCGPDLSKCLVKRFPAIGRFGKKISDFLAMPLC